MAEANELDVADVSQTRSLEKIISKKFIVVKTLLP